ncbi:MAG: ATP-binding protein [Parabacteroides sp.]
MIIRVDIANLFSFNEQTEFNLFPDKEQNMDHHKRTCNDISFLRLGAIYGANGAGKSNLIKAVNLLVDFVRKGKIFFDAEKLKFKLSTESQQRPSSIAIEFFSGKTVYYYSLTFDNSGVLYEALFESFRDNDIRIFERSYEEKETIIFKKEYDDNENNKLFIKVLREKLIKRDDLLLSFLSKNYADEFKEAEEAYEWLTKTLVVITPESHSANITQELDINSKLKHFAEQFIVSVETGISSLDVETKEIEEEDESLLKILSESKIEENLKFKTNKSAELVNRYTGEAVTFVNEGNHLKAKRLITNHKNEKGENIAFSFGLESDGTKRLIGYLPVIYNILNGNHTYLIDEIEKSIHPILIKELISKISEDKKVQGQLIFTTHESCLLDQSILRRDEIWFVQKNKMDGSSQMYSLSDFNVHHTANIENGYLNGRFGAIPFLSNLRDLHWENYE